MSKFLFKRLKLSVFMERIKTIDTDLAAIHGYLCADGYVITHAPNSKRKYYRLGLRNTELVLLSDFQSKFFRAVVEIPLL